MPPKQKRAAAGRGGGRGRGRGDGGDGGDGGGKRSKPSKPSSRVDELAERWAVGSDGDGTFDEALVVDVYGRFLAGGRSGRGRSADLSRLELSGYLERYLWPHFDGESASWEHVMSIVVMLNAKFGEGVDGWAVLRAERARFDAFFGRALGLPSERAEMPWLERAEWVRFLVRAFGSLEEEMVRVQALKLASLPMWLTLSERDAASRLKAQPALSRPWKFVKKRRTKEAELPSGPPLSSQREESFLPSLLRQTVEALALADERARGAATEDGVGDVDDEAEGGGGGGGGGGGDGLARYLEVSLELFIDLMAQLPTRRFFHAVLAD